MGQYYQVVIGSAKGWNKKVLFPHDYDEGLKLLEHGYIDSSLCKKVHSLIYKNPMRIIWIGDYSDDKIDSFYSESNRIKEEKPKSIPTAKSVWKRGSTIKHDTNTNFDCIDYRNKYLVNHTLKVTLDISKYCIESSKNVWGIIDPIPILTVVGNGRGGGDYYGTNENRIGSWKWHLLSIEDSAPSGYIKLNAKNYSFVEGP